MNASEPYLKPILIALLPLGGVLDIAAWRRPHLARFIPYLEMLEIFTIFCCPIDFGTSLDQLICLWVMMLVYILFANFDAASNIGFSAILLIQLFVRQKFVVGNELTANSIFQAVVYTLGSFIFFSLISMLASYIVQIRGKIADATKKDILHLFNGMDEGVVVISAVDNSIEFASASAV